MNADKLMNRIRIFSATLLACTAFWAKADTNIYDAVVIPHGSAIPKITLPTNNWNAAYSWGNHATNNYVKSNELNSATNDALAQAKAYTDSATNGALSQAKAYSDIGSGTNTVNSRLGTVEGWGNHATNNYAKTNASIIPAASNQYSLGSATMPFKDLYLATNSIYMGGQKVLSYDPVTTQVVSSVPIVQQTSPTNTNTVAYVDTATFNSGTNSTLSQAKAYSDVGTGTNTVGSRLGTLEASTAAVAVATSELTGFEAPTAVTTTYDTNSRAITLSQSGGVILWWRNQRINMGSPWTSSAHATNTGKWYLACRTSATPEWSQTPWTFDMAQIAYIYSTTSNIIGFKETHGLMQWQSHEELHRTVGTYRQSGGLLTAGTYIIGDGTATSNTTPAFDSAIIADEDLPSTIAAWPENSYSLLYFTGTGTVNITTNAATLVTVGVNYPLINTVSGGAFTWTTSAVANRWLNYYVIMLPVGGSELSQRYRVLILQPQVQYTTLAAAQAEDFRNLSLGDFTSLAAEFVAVAKVTMGTAAGYAATGRVRIDAVAYLTGSAATQVSLTPMGTPTASSIQTSTSGFTNHLSATDTTVQQALDTLSNLDAVPSATFNSGTNDALVQAKSYTDSATNGVLGQAKSYTDSATNGILSQAKSYTDSATNAVANGTNIWPGTVNSQKLDTATVAWINSKGGGGAGKYTVMLSTTSLNVNVSDVAKTIVMQPTADLTNYLPSVTFGDIGTWYTFVKNGTNRLTIKAADSDTIADSNPGARLYNSATNEYYATVTLQLCNGTNWVITGAHGTWTSTTD